MKPRFSAFYGTNLESILTNLGTETILVRWHFYPAQRRRNSPGRQKSRYAVYRGE